LKQTPLKCLNPPLGGLAVNFKNYTVQYMLHIILRKLKQGLLSMQTQPLVPLALTQMLVAMGVPSLLFPVLPLLIAMASLFATALAPM
jgi:hypothetical protein